MSIHIRHFVGLIYPDLSPAETDALVLDLLGLMEEEGWESPVQAHAELMRRVSPAPMAGYIAIITAQLAGIQAQQNTIIPEVDAHA